MADDDREKILTRLEEMGPEQVQAALAHGALPTHWNATIYEWLAIKRSEQQNAKN